MLKKVLTVTAAAVALIAPITTAQAQPAGVLTCNGTYSGGTYFAVRVRAGASCMLTDATVTHGVFARDAANVWLISSNVARNINVRGTTGMTEIGAPQGCAMDPTVGNNVMVRDSHDVLICQVHAKDNIMVTGNDGQITVRDSAADANIMVNHNLAWVGPPINQHPNPGAIRLLHDTAGEHIHVFGNDPSRDLIFRDDQPTPVVH